MASCRNNEKASPRAKAKAVKEDLGPFYDEARMPAHVYDQLKRGAAPQRLTQIGRDGRLVTETLYNNEVSGIIPVLAKLAALSETVEQAYLCHPAVQHVFKQPREGGFCGYRNLQMLISYIQGAKSEGYGLFQGRVPGILRIQDMIEEAWDRGFCTYGRLQVGRLRGTRKWIGTPEVTAVCLSLGVPTHDEAFSDRSDIPAHEILLDYVEQYFKVDLPKESTKVHKTLRAPIYFQQPGHSLTIVGLERRSDGTRNLFVFDPSFGPPADIMRLLDGKLKKQFTSRDADRVLKLYRRLPAHLEKHSNFETLIVTAPPLTLPVWDMLHAESRNRFCHVYIDIKAARFLCYLAHEQLPLPVLGRICYVGVLDLKHARFVNLTAHPWHQLLVCEVLGSRQGRKHQGQLELEHRNDAVHSKGFMRKLLAPDNLAIDHSFAANH